MKDPAFLFYYQDFAWGTRHMTYEEKGRYIILLCEQGDKGFIEGSAFERISAGHQEIIQKFCKDRYGNYYNKRLREVILKRSNFRKSRVDNLLGKRHMEAHKEAHMGNENRNENKASLKVIKPRIEAHLFDEFWEVYPQRNGKKVGKKKTWQLFQRLNPDDIQRVIQNAKNYGVNNLYPKDPERFLKDDFWKDWDTPQQPQHSQSDERMDNYARILEKIGNNNSLSGQNGHSLPPGNG